MWNSLKKRPKILEAILKSIDRGASILAACESAAVNPSTLWRWCEDNSDLKETINSIRDSRVFHVEDAFYIKLIEGKGQAAEYIYYLNTRAPKRWPNLTHKHELSGTITHQARLNEMYKAANKPEEIEDAEYTSKKTKKNSHNTNKTVKPIKKGYKSAGELRVHSPQSSKEIVESPKKTVHARAYKNEKHKSVTLKSR